MRYIIPSRVNVQVNNRARGHEDMISVEHELEGEDSMGCPHREEGYILLMLRAERAYKINSWSENPPARTRRIVGNIELMEQRRDSLLSQTDGFRIIRREVVLDYAAIELPTLGLFF